MENNRDIVLFLGAGFSKLAGLPTMNTFGEESKNEIDRIDLGIKNQKRGIEKFQYFRQKGIIFTQFKDYCKNSEKFVKFDENNLEDIFCMAEIYKNYGPDEIRLKNENMILKELYKDIQIWLWKIYQQLPASTSRNKENMINPKPYEKLIQIIKGLGIEKRLFILTTNYDIVFEYFAFKEKINCCYPFSKNDYHSINSGDNNKYIFDYDDDNSNDDTFPAENAVSDFIEDEVPHTIDSINDSITDEVGEPITPAAPILVTQLTEDELNQASAASIEEGFFLGPSELVT